jgi:hypothetical protein
MDQNRKSDQDMPNRASEIEQAEGSRDSRERGWSSETERESPGRSNSGGITNRPLDRENCEQERLPDRGRSQSEH